MGVCEVVRGGGWKNYGENGMTFFNRAVERFPGMEAKMPI